MGKADVLFAMTDGSISIKIDLGVYVLESERVKKVLDDHYDISHWVWFVVDTVEVMTRLLSSCSCKSLMSLG